MRVLWLTLLALLVVSCATPEVVETATESLLEDAGAPPRAEGAWALAGGDTLRLVAGQLSLAHGADEWPIADEVYGAATVSDVGHRFAYCRRGDGVEAATIEVWERDSAGAKGGWSGPRELVGGDRPALSPDGEWLAFVSGRTGVASMWLIPLAGGDPLQLTNAGLEDHRVPGQPPAGFVPPPHRGPPAFDGDRLVWEAPDGDHGVDLP